MTSLAICIGVERLTRRLLPLAALLKLSMLFSDRAPNRFRLARGAASTKMLNQRVAQARTHDAAAVAGAVLELITALTAHDRRTRGHCERVRVFVELLGDELHLPRDSRDKLRWASLLHDIGKLEVAPEILNKPAKLTRSEFEIVAEHPAHGEELLGPLIEWLGEWGAAVRQHHERFDGTGYPDQLAGTDISRAARIVSIAESYEVMTAHRAYKRPMATVAARAELADCAGTQFDPTFVRAFLSISLPRLLWAMGPGALLMNLPMLRVLADTTYKGLLAIPQSAVAAAAASAVIGGVAATGAPVAMAASVAAGARPTASASASATGHDHATGPVQSGRARSAQPSRTGGAGPGSVGPTVLGPTVDTGTGSPADSGQPPPSDGVPAAIATEGPVTSTTSPDPMQATAAAPTTAAAPATTAAPPTTVAPTTAAPLSAPVLLSTPPASGLLPTVTFSWVQVAGLSYEYQLGSGGWTSLGAAHSLTTVVLIGSYQFRLRARNASGTTSPDVRYSFTVIA